MKITLMRIERNTTEGTDVFDLTEDVLGVLLESGVLDGLLTVFTPGSTAAITTIEYESGVIADLRSAIERMAPRDLHYEHDARWGDGNGYAHVRSALLGPSISVPVEAGAARLGTWQQIVLCDFDNRPRKREVLVQVVGE